MCFVCNKYLRLSLLSSKCKEAIVLGKDKVIPLYTMNACGMSGATAPFILILSTSWR
jgi:hypothetical protein